MTGALVDVRLHLHRGVDTLQVRCQDLSLGKSLPRIRLLVTQLAVEVRPFHDVAVDQTDGADAGAHQIFRRVAAECAAANDQDPGGPQPRLALLAQRGVNSLTRVAIRAGNGGFFRFGGHTHCVGARLLCSWKCTV